ncbi:hypothetical protein JG687_00017099 [Phytophthora cactorum]|uniref:DDE-1 domain-containing protein n=1 Tax=Phytophthora cactorum TaxID=29920 RepID=A0A8T1TQ82_9STRA|nr:hypothetical protein JG687_00017099 [Phytophthora cactorum]
MDGCTSHYSVEVLEAAEKIGVLLVLFSANATHLIQPLDVAVFSNFKACIKGQADICMASRGGCALRKTQAITMESSVWTLCNFEANIKSGFRCCGLYPLTKVKMAQRLEDFVRNGAPEDTELAAWLKIKDVQQETPVLPPTRQRTRARKMVTVGGNLLTRQILDELASAKPIKKTEVEEAAQAGQEQQCDVQKHHHYGSISVENFSLNESIVSFNKKHGMTCGKV